MMINDKSEIDKVEFLKFLWEIDCDFPIPLSEKVSIEDYCDKLWDKAEVVIDSDEDGIRGIAAGYTINLENFSAYLSIVGVSPKFRGEGIGKGLVKSFIDVCEGKEEIHSINVYTHKTNLVAIKMYEALGFERYKMNHEIRTEDIHFIKYL